MTAKDDKTLISVHVIKGAHTNRVDGWQDGVLRVRLRVAPEKGKANKALIELLADYFLVAKSEVEIVSGTTSHNKRIRLPVKEVKDT